MKKIKNFIKNPKLIIIKILNSKFFRFIDDESIIRVNYWVRFGKKIDLDNPKEFNEIIHWLKLHERSINKTDMTDKLKVRTYIEEKIGIDYLIPIIGQWKKFEDIDFSSLPEKFVLKCNHDSQSSKVISKNDLTIKYKRKLKKFYNYKIKQNYYYKSREWNYKDIDPYIIAEEFIETEDGTDLKDFKLFCFNGKVKYIQVDSDRFSDHNRSIYTSNWEKTKFSIHHSVSSDRIEAPQNLDKMIKFAELLSLGIKHVRVDFYESFGRLYFGELTFHHGGGYEIFSPQNFSQELASYVNIEEEL